ncbi:hypothetical protein MPSEU_000155200 [Mayamaea pseudoterrestris]|nr:hypothetical protein MPSEU_000155200 [Mayamaea pseudoterrestris]
MVLVIRLRSPTAWEKSWLSLDPRGNKHDDLLTLGFQRIGKCYSHPLLVKESSSKTTLTSANHPSNLKTWSCVDEVVASMLHSGIPNAHLLDADRLQALEWTIRTQHVDWTTATDARESLKGMNPALASHIATEETIEMILTKRKVVFDKERNRIYLAGALENGNDETLLHGVHYVHSLHELRVLYRQTGSLAAPNAKSTGRRTASSSVTPSETLVLQLWAATAPYTLPVFDANAVRACEADTDDNNVSLMKSPLDGLERVEEADEEESDDDEDELEEQNAEQHGEQNGTCSNKSKYHESSENDSDADDGSAGDREASKASSTKRAFHRVSLGMDDDASEATTDAPAFLPQKKARTRKHAGSSKCHSTAAATRTVDAAWLQQKTNVLSLLFNDFELTDAGVAVYQVLELQTEGCREYDAVKHSIQMGLTSGHGIKATTQRTIDLLGQRCLRMWNESTILELDHAPISI